MIKYILGLSLFFSSLTFAQASDDNEINITQIGDTLTLYIDQVGYGNKIGLDNFSSSSSASPITGSSLTFNIDQLVIVTYSMVVLQQTHHHIHSNGMVIVMFGIGK